MRKHREIGNACEIFLAYESKLMLIVYKNGEFDLEQDWKMLALQQQRVQADADYWASQALVFLKS